MSESVRSRLSVEAGQNRAVTADHSTAKWGTLSVTQRIENQRQVSYVTSCTCGAHGQRVSQMELSSGVIPVCRFCAGTGTAPGDARRTYNANVEQRVREDVVLSPRQRAEMKQRAEEQKQFEEGSNAEN